jgi:hypothetical protein
MIHHFNYISCVQERERERERDEDGKHKQNIVNIQTQIVDRPRTTIKAVTIIMIRNA